MKLISEKFVKTRILLVTALVLTFSLILFTGLPSFQNNNIFNLPETPLPGTGVWNGYNDHMIVLECSNNKTEKQKLELLLKDHQNKVIGVEDFIVEGKGVSHVILNKFPIKNSYGTLQLSASSNKQPPSITCQTITYRLDKSNQLQYATSNDPGDNLKGKTSGVYNSMNPDQNSQNPVYNWLTIYNPSDTPFSAIIKVRDQNGNLIPDEEVKLSQIPPGGRQDISLGHPKGQTVGIYEIFPGNDNFYGAYLSRYSEIEPGNFSFSMNIPSSKGLKDSGLVPASSMGPAINWAEIANINTEEVNINLEIFDRSGSILESKSILIPPYAQHHEFLNKHIGELNVGFFRVKSNNPVLVQSMYYGVDTQNNSKINWAYNVAGGQSFHEEASLLINTNLGSANWLKIFGGSSDSPLSIEMKIFDQSGAQLSLGNKNNISVKGSTDIPIHEFTGSDFTGKIELKELNGDNTFQAQVIRVFSNTSKNNESKNEIIDAKNMSDISARNSGDQPIISHIMPINAPINEAYKFFKNNFKELDILITPETYPLIVHPDGFLGYNGNGYFLPMTFVSTDKKANLSYFSIYPKIDLDKNPEFRNKTVTPEEFRFNIKSNLSVHASPAFNSSISRTNLISDSDYMETIQNFIFNKSSQNQINNNGIIPFYFPEITHDQLSRTEHSPCSLKHSSPISMCFIKEPDSIKRFLAGIYNTEDRNSLLNRFTDQISNFQNNRFIKECENEKIVYSINSKNSYTPECSNPSSNDPGSNVNKPDPSYNQEQDDLNGPDPSDNEDQDDLKKPDPPKNEEQDDVNKPDPSDNEEQDDNDPPEDYNCPFAIGYCDDDKDPQDCEKLKEECADKINNAREDCSQLRALQQTIQWCNQVNSGYRDCPEGDEECIYAAAEEARICIDVFEDYNYPRDLTQEIFECTKKANELHERCENDLDRCYRDFIRPYN